MAGSAATPACLRALTTCNRNIQKINLKYPKKEISKNKFGTSTFIPDMLKEICGVFFFFLLTSVNWNKNVPMKLFCTTSSVYHSKGCSFPVPRKTFLLPHNTLALYIWRTVRLYIWETPSQPTESTLSQVLFVVDAFSISQLWKSCYINPYLMLMLSLVSRSRRQR